MIGGLYRACVVVALPEASAAWITVANVTVSKPFAALQPVFGDIGELIVDVAVDEQGGQSNLPSGYPAPLTSLESGGLYSESMETL